MTSIARLIVRVVVGGLLAGHGAQKLFGSFGGYGVEGTAGWLESMNLRPGRQWAIIAGLSEFGGGVLTVLGALNPIGPIMSMGSMLMATVKVHAGKPIWVTAGGAELPVTNMAVQTALILVGPGKLSFDGLLGIRIPRWFGLASLAGMLATVAVAVSNSRQAAAAEASETEQEAGHELQGGKDETMTPGPAGATDGTDGAARPGVESWGSPDSSEPEPEPITSNPSPS
jgi:putative oxidoreductase